MNTTTRKHMALCLRAILAGREISVHRSRYRGIAGTLLTEGLVTESAYRDMMDLEAKAIMLNTRRHIRRNQL